MTERDPQGRPLVNSPGEALAYLADQYPAHRFVACLTVEARLKVSLVTEYEHMMRESERAVASARAAGQGEAASRWREVELFVHALRDEIRMWLHLDDHNAHDAWETLVRAQCHAHWAAGVLPDYEPAQQLGKHLDDIEGVIFPKQRFFSPAMIINEGSVECSVCHERGGQCDHLAGEIYNGEIAARIVHEILEVREVSLVDDPANRSARALAYDGMDLLTGGRVTSVKRRDVKRRRSSVGSQE